MIINLTNRFGKGWATFFRQGIDFPAVRLNLSPSLYALFKRRNHSVVIPKHDSPSFNHIALIPDGNRRWARSKGLDVCAGYKTWSEKIPELVLLAYGMNVHTFTLWLASPENLRRPKEEVASFLKASDVLTDAFLDHAASWGIKIVHTGSKEQLPAYLVNKFEIAEKQTRNYQSHILNLGVNYSNEEEVLNAMRHVAEKKLQPNAINRELVNKLMYTEQQKYPKPDLIIRTGDALRLSGFMGWHSAFSEIHFSKKLFPDFTAEDFYQIIKQSQQQERRFGR